MPSNPISVSGQYLTGMLASGSRPFLYRSGVHRLLGVPPRAETAVKFLPPLPPVGFQYERERAFSGLPRSMPWSDGGALFSHGATAGETVSVRNTGNSGKETQPQVPVTPASASSRSVKQGVSGVRTEGDDYRRALETPGQHSVETKHTGLEIPGITHRRALLANLSAKESPQEGAALAQRPLSPTASVKKDAQRATSVGENAGSSGMPPLALGTKAGDPPRALEASADRSAEPKRTGLEIPGVVQRRSLLAALSGQRPMQQEAASSERLGLQPTAAAKAQPRTVDSSAPRHAARTPYGPSGPVQPEDDPRQPTRISTEPKRRAGSIPLRPAPVSRPAVKEEKPTLFQSRPRAAEEVEHLRQAVAKLAARQTTPRIERREESPASEPNLVPSQPLVVVQRVPGPIRQTSRALWASSTLRSTHLRMLR